MICRNCLRVASRAQSSHSTHRVLTTTTTSRFSNASAPQTSSPSSSVPSAAQPVSAVPSPSSAQAAEQAKKKATPLVKSSIPAGVPLKGLNFLKNAQDPVALPDDEYPAWLWTVLDRKEKKDESGGGDLFSKSKKQRRVAAKRLRKEQAMNPALLIPKIPIYEQTIDLPSGDGSLAGAAAAADARAELTKAMRDRRRASIKEANFLKSMG